MLVFHNFGDLISLELSQRRVSLLVPGDQVRHKEDAKSYGIIISVNPERGQAFLVDWSRQPTLPTLEETLFQRGLISREFANRVWTVEDAKAAYDAGLVRDVTFEHCSDGEIKIHVVLFDEPEPDYAFYPLDGQAQAKQIRFGRRVR